MKKKSAPSGAFFVYKKSLDISKVVFLHRPTTISSLFDIHSAFYIVLFRYKDL